MSAHQTDEGDGLPPELLAAYADGELTPAECRRVEAWLTRHPEAAGEVEAQRRLTQLCDRAAPPLPSDDEWAAVLARVESGLAAPPARRPAWPRRAALVLAPLAAAAAVVLLALALKGPPPGGDSTPPDPGPTAEEPWQWASDDDVHVISMDPGRVTLLVGEPPASGPMEWAQPDDVKVSELAPDDQGRVGRLWVPPGPGTPPMVVIPPERDP
jgi:hypothetical protein